VTFGEDKTPWARADVLVLADRPLDHLVATEPGAFAAKPDPFVLLAGPLAALDRLVDLAKPRFVSRYRR
jgi:hypothetical protein